VHDIIKKFSIFLKKMFAHKEFIRNCCDIKQLKNKKTTVIVGITIVFFVQVCVVLTRRCSRP